MHVADRGLLLARSCLPQLFSTLQTQSCPTSEAGRALGLARLANRETLDTSSLSTEHLTSDVRPPLTFLREGAC